MNPASEPLDRVTTYVAAIVSACDGGEGLVSIVVFGSVATGGYSPGVSDVDLLVVLDDSANSADREHVSQIVTGLELRLGLAKRRPDQNRFELRAIQSLVDKITGNVRTFFICTKADLLSGEPGRILGLPRFQAAFVDRIAIPSIVGSGTTLWGEELLPRVPLPPIRRYDVGKAGFGLLNQAFVALAVYPLLPEATRYAMEALKRSLHSCYFCFHGCPAPLTEEIAFFEERYGPDPAYGHLVRLRDGYKRSLGFIAHSLRAIARLHAVTVRDATFRSGVITGRRPAS